MRILFFIILILYISIKLYGCKTIEVFIISNITVDLFCIKPFIS